MSRKIGALWIRQSQDGRNYLSGVIQDLSGDIIGKQGQSINAIRSVINIIGRKNQAKVNVKLDVPEVRRGTAKPESYL